MRDKTDFLIDCLAVTSVVNVVSFFLIARFRSSNLLETKLLKYYKFTAKFAE
jgi:hypothetical protein